MSHTHAMPWPEFGERSERFGWQPPRWMRMTAEHGGRGKRRGHRGRSGFSADDPAGGLRPPFPPGFGPPGDDRRAWHAHFRGGGPRVRRGDVRAAVLALLAEEPRNGYQIIQEIAKRSDGIWRPSAGSVYPALQQLQDEGLARATESGTRRLFELTEEGRAYVEEHAEECAAPWETVRDTVGQDPVEIRELVRQVGIAAMQVLQAGSASQVAEMRKILTGTRRSLYRILARDEASDADGSEVGTVDRE
jgi:DNA-binding PadR family transcriptional regulator